MPMKDNAMKQLEEVKVDIVDTNVPREEMKVIRASNVEVVPMLRVKTDIQAGGVGGPIPSLNPGPLPSGVSPFPQ